MYVHERNESLKYELQSKRFYNDVKVTQSR